MSDTVNVAIIGVGNCASSLVQGVQYYRDADPDEFVPGLMHVDLGGYHVRDINFTAAFDIDVAQGGPGPLARPSSRSPTTPSSWPTCPNLGVTVAARHDPRRPRQVPLRGHHQGARPDGRHRRHPARHQHPRGRELPAGRLRERHQVVRRADPARRLRVRELHPGVHRPRALLAGALPRARPPDRGRRHQEPGRRHHRAPPARPPDARARRASWPTPSQLNFGGNTDFLNMLERERLESKKISQDQRGHLDHGRRDRPRRTSTSARATTCRG